MSNYHQAGQWIATALAVVGVLLNNAQIRYCFLLWIGSNILTAHYHYKTKLWGLLCRDVIFTILAVAGWIQWSYMI